MMLGAGPLHALAPELSLRPVLTAIGATVPSRSLYVVDATFDDPAAYADWLAAARPHAPRSSSQARLPDGRDRMSVTHSTAS